MIKTLFRQITRAAAVLSLTAIAFDASAQINMVRSIFAAPYDPISIPGGATAATTAQADDAIQTAVPIGFTFNYLGTGYTSVAICSNGWLSFTATAQTATNTNLYTTTAPNATLAPWFDDLFPTEVLFQTVGTPGSQVFIVQWYGPSYFTGTTNNNIGYQAKLYEATGEIEFCYDVAPTGTRNAASESASIGIESTTGGNGQYIDAVSGSSFTGNATLQSNRWPAYNFRFTPGVPTVLAGGTYNVGVGQTFINLNEAAAEMNHRGISGAITLNLTDANYGTSVAGGSNFFPVLFGPIAGNSSTNTIAINGNNAVVTYGGTGAGSVANQASTTAISGTTAEPIIGLVGADYVTISNLTVQGGVGGTADAAIGIYNSSATDGAGNNVIQNVTLSMDRANTSSRGILMNVPTTPSAASGTNSNNTFRDFSITNVYGGIQITGNTTTTDVGNIITNSVCTNFNTIGNGSVANDIGNAATQTAGIRVTNQSGIMISNNFIQNVSANGAVVTDGIFGESMRGNSAIYNNKIQNIRNNSTSSTSGITGIRVSNPATGTIGIGIFNNTISGITSAYTGAASATRAIKGINVASGGGGATTIVYEVFNNSVSIDGSSSLNLSSACFEVGTTSGPVFNIGNNIFANFTAAQTGIARHYSIVSTAAASLGNTGTVSNNNDLFVANDAGTTGFVGLGNATTYTDLTAWQTAMSQDAASVSINPQYLNNTSDLHVAALGLNAVGRAYPVYITQDLDCAARTDNDLGAYIIEACAGAPTAGSITGAASVCDGTGTTLTLSGASSQAGVSYQWGVATTPGGPYTNAGTTTTQATGNLTTATYYVVTVTCSVSGMSAVTSEKAVTIDALPTLSLNASSNTLCYPVTAPVTLTASGSSVSYAWSPATGLSATTGASVDASTSGSRTYTVVGTGANGCTSSANTTISVLQTPNITAATATPSSVCSGANSQLNVAVSPMNGNVLITEVTVFRTGTGATPSYPAYLTGADLVEISNVSASPVDISGYTLADYPNNSAASSHPVFTFPVGTVIPVGGVAVVCLGAGTDDIANRYFNTTGTSDSWSSTSQVGIVLKNGAAVVDAVGLGGTAATYTFAAATGVTAADFTGFAPNASGLAGVIRTVATDNNVGADWTASGAANLQSQGTNNGIYPSGNTVSYAWSPATFLSATNIANPMANAITSSITYLATVSASGCQDTMSVSISAGSVLSATANATPGATVCANTDVTLNAVPVGGGAPYTFVWDGPLSFTSTSQNPVLTAVTTAMSGTYNVTITDNCGATATSSVAVTVNALPVVAVTPSSATFCTPGGSAVGLTASGANTYSWSPAAGLSATTGTSVNATPSATTTYTVTGTDANNCTASATAAITAAPQVVLNTVTATLDTVCNNGSTQLDASAIVMGPVNTYNFAAGTGATLDPMVGATQVLNPNNDDNPTAAPAAIGFPFVYNGTIYTQYSISPDGWILLGGATAVNQFTNAVTSATNIPKIYPYWDDVATGTDGNVKVLVTGTAPNRIFIAQWFVTIPRNTTGPANSTFQAWLYEADGKIEFRYGAMNTATSTTISGGLTAATTNFHSITFASNTSSPSTANDANATATPANGTIYTYTLPAADYAWSPATFLSATNIANPMASNMTASTTYTLTASHVGGCSDMETIDIVVGGTPTAMATASPNDTVCANTDVTLGVTITDAIAPITYVWSGPLGFASTAASPMLTAVTSAMSGTYSVTITDNCGNNAVSSIDVVINAVPTVSLGGSASACGSMMLDAGAGANSYLWSDNSTNQTLTVTSSNTYSVTVTSANGCTATDAAAITINAVPSVDLGADTTVCGSLTIDAGAGFADYSWNTTETTQSITTTSSNLLSVTVTDANNCTATDDINVSVNTSPNVDLGGNATACDDYTLDAGAGNTYLWSDNSTNQTLTVTSSGGYAVTVTAANGCAGSDAVTITINNSPSPSLGNDVTACGDTDLNAGAGFDAYLWSNNATSQTINVTASGTYSVTVTDNGCTGSDDIVVTINTNPTVSLGVDTLLCLESNDAITLNAGSFSTYLWSTDPVGSTGDGSTNQTVDLDAVGLGEGTFTYSVVVEDANGCLGLDDIVIDVQICSGVDHINGEQYSINVFPNPNQGVFNVMFTDLPNSESMMELMDVQGRIINTQRLNGNTGNVQLHFSDLASGVYMLRVVGDDFTNTQRIIIVK